MMGKYGCKWLFPSVMIGYTFIICFGPHLFPEVHEKLVRIAVVIVLAQVVLLTVSTASILYKSLSVPIRQPNELKPDVVHAWVLPNYNEEQHVLRASLTQLASHPLAKQYVVFLAMEEHEKHSEKKAESIIRNYNGSFRHIGYTVHRISKGEAKGKASNVSYCVERFKEVMPSTVVLDKVYVTIMDCDGMAPKEYIDEVNAAIYNNPEKSFKTLFCPSKFMQLNRKNIILPIRSLDDYQSMLQWGLEIPGADMALAVSNYTVSYKAVESMGFWDKHADAITEDIHIGLKGFFSRNEDFYAQQIQVPFNELNIEDNKGYLSNLNLKFWQTVRHAYILKEGGYVLDQFLHQKQKTPRSWAVLVFMLNLLYFSQLIMIFTSVGLYKVIWCVLFPSSATADNYWFACLTITIAAFYTAAIIMRHIFVRYAVKRYFNIEPPAFWRFVEYFVFFLVGVWVFMIPGIYIATIIDLFTTPEYHSAVKKSTHNKNKS